MKCKNCGNDIIKKTALNGSGKTWYEHKPSEELFGLSYGGNCTIPEPESERIVVEYNKNPHGKAEIGITEAEVRE